MSLLHSRTRPGLTWCVPIARTVPVVTVRAMSYPSDLTGPRAALPNSSALDPGSTAGMRVGAKTACKPRASASSSAGVRSPAVHTSWAYDVGLEALEGLGDPRGPVAPGTAPSPDVPRHHAQGVLHLAHPAVTRRPAPPLHLTWPVPKREGLAERPGAGSASGDRPKAEGRCGVHPGPPTRQARRCCRNATSSGK